jgi:hypothetical protein
MAKHQLYLPSLILVSPMERSAFIPPQTQVRAAYCRRILLARPLYVLYVDMYVLVLHQGGSILTHCF